MLDDLDRTLRKLLVEELPRVIEKIGPDGFDVSFDVPNRELKARLAKPTLCLYLYNIQENRDLRGRAWDQRRENGSVATRRPPVRLDCSYMVTAWSNEVEDEHRLLTGAARVLFRNPTLPPAMLQGTLADGVPITTEVAQPESFKDIVDIWSVLDNDLRPSVRVTVTVPLDVDVEYATPITRAADVRGPDTSYRPPDGRPQRMEGKLLRGGRPVPNARLRVDLSSTVTDKQGVYVLGQVVPGRKSVLVEVDGALLQVEADLPGAGVIELPPPEEPQATPAGGQGGGPGRARRKPRE